MPVLVAPTSCVRALRARDRNLRCVGHSAAPGSDSTCPRNSSLLSRARNHAPLASKCPVQPYRRWPAAGVRPSGIAPYSPTSCELPGDLAGSARIRASGGSVMTASALVGVSGPPVDDEVQAAAIWTALAGSLVVPGRRYQVKQVSTGRKYSRRPVRRPLNLPSRPTAALLFDGDGLAHWLGCDLDVGAASSEEVLAAGRLVESVLFSAGFGPFMDMSPRGGVHVWARLNAPEAKAVVLAVLRGIQSLVASRFPQVKLDLAPMSNLKEGCLSLPGSPCVGGGWRRLADGLDRAVAAVQHRPGPEALNRLADLLDVQFGRWDVVDNMLVDDGDQPVLPGPAKPLPTHTLAYLRDGEIAPHAGQSEARRSALLTMIWHRWTLAMTQQEIDAGNFTGLASDISRPGKGGHRYLAQEWCRARTAVLTALR